MSADDLVKAGITEGTIRLSIGLEDPEDLIEDLSRALLRGGQGGIDAPGRRTATRRTRTRARARSSRRSRRSCSCTAPPTTTAYGRCSRATSRITATTCSRVDLPGSRALGRRGAGVGRGDRGLAAAGARCRAASSAPRWSAIRSARSRASQCAARAPRTRDKLALLGPAVPMPVSEVLLAAAQGRRSRRLRAHQRLVAQRRRTARRQPVPGMWMTGNALRLMERTPPGVLHVDLTACNAYADGLDAAARVRCPALLRARRSATSWRRRERAGAGRRRCADVRVVTLAGAGHAMMAEQPDAVLDALAPSCSGRAPLPGHGQTRRLLEMRKRRDEMNSKPPQGPSWSTSRKALRHCFVRRQARLAAAATLFFFFLKKIRAATRTIMNGRCSS